MRLQARSVARCFVKNPCLGRPMSALQASKPESPILDKMCTLDYASKAGYSDNGQEATILAIHDDDRERDLEILRETGDRGTEIEGEMPDRAIIPLAIQGGADLPVGIFVGRKAIYEREAVR